MQQVLRRVRQDQGPDAVILSNRRVDDGIEVIAAIDYDEALIRHALGPAEQDAVINGDVLAKLAEDDVPAPVRTDVEIVAADIHPVDDTVPDEVADPTSLSALQSEISSMRWLLETQLSGLVWKDTSQRQPIRAQVLRNLSRIGLAPDVANIVVDRLDPLDEIKSLWSTPLTSLAQVLPVIDDTLLQQGGTAALIGPTGVGKTTTIAKIATHFAMNNWVDDIALVSADAYRVGAKEHLAAFANIIGANVYAASDFDELSEILHQLRDKKLVLIDTEGRSQRDRELCARLAAYGRNADRVKFYLTLSAATQEASLEEMVREFKQVPLAGCIVTKVDEAAQLGCVMSVLIRHDLPAAYFSDGQRIPEDLYPAVKKKLWLVQQAVECLEASQAKIDEQTMAERFSPQGVAHA